MSLAPRMRAACLAAEDYWLAQPGVEMVIRASDHLFYPAQHLPRLEAAIRRLHALVRSTAIYTEDSSSILPDSSKAATCIVGSSCSMHVMWHERHLPL